jgi:hypothetical protein
MAHPPQLEFFGYLFGFRLFCVGVGRRLRRMDYLCIVQAFKPVSGSQAVAWQSDRWERYERLRRQMRIQSNIIFRGQDAATRDRSGI